MSVSLNKSSFKLEKRFTRAAWFIGNVSWNSVITLKARDLLMKWKMTLTFSFPDIIHFGRQPVRWRHLTFSSSQLRDSFSWNGFGLSLGFRALVFVRKWFEEISFKWLAYFQMKTTEVRYRICMLPLGGKKCLSTGQFSNSYLPEQIHLLRLSIGLSEHLFSADAVHLKFVCMFCLFWGLSCCCDAFKQLMVFSLLCSLLCDGHPFLPLLQGGTESFASNGGCCCRFFLYC